MISTNHNSLTLVFSGSHDQGQAVLRYLSTLKYKYEFHFLMFIYTRSWFNIIKIKP